MYSSTALENPDIDYKEMYQEHKCTIDFNSAEFHDTSDLVEFSDLERFLDFYRDCGLNEKGWKSDIVVPTTISTLSNMCKNCNHSKNVQKAKPGSGNETADTKNIYHIPGIKDGFPSCPLDEHFSRGVEVHLEYPLRREVECNHCGNRTPRPYCYDQVNLSFFDVRLNGTPAKLIVSRKEEVCPHCLKRIAVDLIPRIQVDLKYQMSVRLIHAITEHSINKGISGFCKKQIAQGYGISYELLKKFYKDTFDGLRKKAKQVYSEYIENESKAKFSYTCITPKYSLFLCFSEFDRKENSPELYLCAAFDKKEIDVVDSWIHGNFSPVLPSGLSDRHLDFLAKHYAGIAFPDIDQVLAFRMVQLVIAYGKFMKSRRGAVEDPMITSTLTTCLHTLSTGDMDFHQFERLIMTIADWSSSCRKQRIFRAVRRVLAVLDTYFAYQFSTPLRARVQSLSNPPTKDNLACAEHIARLIERSLLRSAQWQGESNEDPEECYGTNSELSILRLLYINSAVSYDPQGDTYIGTPLYGVPVSKLEPLLVNGLLDDRGHSQPNFIHDTPLQ